MGPHEGADSADAHVSFQLEDYLLGRLSGPDTFTVEAHLLRCPQCRAEADELSSVVAMVASLPPTVVQSIEESTPSSGARTPTDQPGDERRPARSPQSPSGPNQFRRALVLAATLVLGAALGAAGLMWLGPDKLDGAAVSNDSQAGTSGRLAVTVVERAGGGIDVSVVVVGLQPGIGFELLAIAGDGRNYVVARGVAAGGPQTIRGDLPIAASSVRFFAVLQSEGKRLFVSSLP